MKKILLFILFPTLTFSQTQIGSDIDGKSSGDLFGTSVALSDNGNILAIGASGEDTNPSHFGYVSVYENIGGTWTQIGADIDGEAAGDLSGISISLSLNGSVVAIGADNNNGINGVGSGHVRIYENIGGTWTQIGQNINGEDELDFLGHSLCLSSDGSIVAIGAESGNANNSGYVRIYKNIGGTWTQIGNDIDGEATDDYSGWSVSLSSDGDIVAIGAEENDGNGAESGHVRVYENIGGTWTQIGADIDGEAADNESGYSVSLSSNGSIVAIGAVFNSGSATESGHVRIYKNIGGTWIQIGVDIDGEAADDNSGASVSLSSDGSKLAIGADYNAGGGLDSGHVRVYDLSALLSTDSFKLDYFTFYPNPVKNDLNIELNKGLVLKKVNIYNSLGQFISSTEKLKINRNNLKSGIYFVEVETSQGKSAKKIVIE